MAKLDEEEEMEELEEEPAPGKKTPGGKAGKGGLPLVPLILAIVIGGGAIAGGRFFAWSKFFASSPKGQGKGLQAGGTMGEKANIGVIEPLETFIVNLADNGGKRFLKVGINLELSDPELGEEVKNKLPVIRDAILVLLSSKGYAEIGDARGKSLLREEVLARINPFLKEGRIKRVYFSEFVVQ